MLIRFKNFVDELETKVYYRYLVGALVIFTALLVLLFYLHNNRISSLDQEIHKINRERQQARELLEKHTIIQQQKLEVDDILSQDKTFKIKEYFSQTVNDLNLGSKLAKDTEISEPQDLENGYSEIKLDASFTKLNMKELSELLYQTETSRRIYTKELVITQAPNSQTIDATIVIATLQPKSEI
jgi:hypothetical protein